MSIQWKVEQGSCISDQAGWSLFFALRTETWPAVIFLFFYFFGLTLRCPSIPVLRSSHPSQPTSCCSLLCLAVWWVLTETCCLGSSIMHPLPRDIMCDKWPISVQTPIGPWPRGVGAVRASVGRSVYICLFVYESMIALQLKKWGDEGRLCELMSLVYVFIYFLSMSGQVVLMWAFLQQQSACFALLSLTDLEESSDISGCK